MHNFINSVSDFSLSSWDVAERPAIVDGKTVPGWKALTRNDNGQILNICKTSYSPTTNATFIETAERMSDITGYPIRDICEVDNGRKTLAFLECTKPLTVNEFEFKDYLMLGNSHDGSSSFFIGNSNMMIRCQNRFARRFRQMQVYHRAGNTHQIDIILSQFRYFVHQRNHQYKKFEEFSKIEISDEIRTALAQRLAGLTQEEILGKTEISTRKGNIVSSIYESIYQESEDTGFTLFGAFNGITHYTTHKRKNAHNESFNIFNTAGEMNTKAYEFCLEYAKNN